MLFHFRQESTPNTVDPDWLRVLAREKGFTAQRAIRPNLWRLVRADGTAAVDPVTHDTGFTYYDALEFLNSAPDQRY